MERLLSHKIAKLAEIGGLLRGFWWLVVLRLVSTHSNTWPVYVLCANTPLASPKMARKFSTLLPSESRSMIWLPTSHAECPARKT